MTPKKEHLGTFILLAYIVVEMARLSSNFLSNQWYNNISFLYLYLFPSFVISLVLQYNLVGTRWKVEERELKKEEKAWEQCRSISIHQLFQFSGKLMRPRLRVWFLPRIVSCFQKNTPVSLLPSWGDNLSSPWVTEDPVSAVSSHLDLPRLD